MDYDFERSREIREDIGINWKAGIANLALGLAIGYGSSKVPVEPELVQEPIAGLINLLIIGRRHLYTHKHKLTSTAVVYYNLERDIGLMAGTTIGLIAGNLEDKIWPAVERLLS